MTLPSFSALAATSRCGAFGSTHSQYNNNAVVNSIGYGDDLHAKEGGSK